MKNVYIKIPLSEYDINDDFPSLLENDKKGFAVFRENSLIINVNDEIVKINLLMYIDQTNKKYIEVE